MHRSLFVCARSCVCVCDGLFGGVCDFGVSMYVFGEVTIDGVCVCVIEVLVHRSMFVCTRSCVYIRDSLFGMLCEFCVHMYVSLSPMAKNIRIVTQLYVRISLCA